MKTLLAEILNATMPSTVSLSSRHQQQYEVKSSTLDCQCVSANSALSEESCVIVVVAPPPPPNLLSIQVQSYGHRQHRTC